MENNHKQSAQRETAIMAVCDIDEIVQSLKDEIHLEDSLFKVAMYVLTHQELIDSLSMDTLDMAFEYLYDNPTVIKCWMADTKETAFNSSLDARMNIGNHQFYDNVQSCYYMRRSLTKVMADAPEFSRPLSKEAYEDFLYKLDPFDINWKGVPVPNARRDIMKQIFAQHSTTLYIKRYFFRKDTYMETVNELDLLNCENKVLMDISDKDIETYLKRNSGNMSALSFADLIIGTWDLNLGNNQNTYYFHEDNTLEQILHLKVELQFQLEEQQKEVFVLSPMTTYMEGRWELRDDTLITDFDASTAAITSFEVDLSNFPQASMEDVKDSIEIKKNMMKQFFLEEMRHMTLKKEYLISFDKSTNTMAWRFKEATPAGNNKEKSVLLYRKNE
ncbi:MAG: hypothetical protein K5945_05075 [Bacteroidaceae bacterium]|nr:hypothetical protein [Bacteroidaceae bacterium]